MNCADAAASQDLAYRVQNDAAALQWTAVYGFVPVVHALAALAGRGCHLRGSDAAVRARFGIGCGHQLGDRIAYAQPVAGARYADVLQRLVIDIPEQVHLDIGCLEGVGVLPEADARQPRPDVAHDASSSSSAFASSRSGLSKPSVNQS